ncbi:MULTISPECIES: DUF1826 domain-containing protein [unclassified Pseudomonas]|uniref:DUF1826 domain-containing protein n=1 Tax=unclassified Pseudomonas TaxID=196821 RepID=UPI000BC50692|nr:MULTISPECIES: DUF1826 domain-containing protein [unclassified Pseudomonas]PVZ13623.1 uncharacterized protein DUF1826 [Pseudomonas sp. URIL14HWK12:I12]PVZ23929.1 uncharacterized protein DUF1826 [Pseudomonas sp. URIL14HWK12:I10]PVZ33432.1 uncharacterized protein DUF1826 [Pseudomonas sp. URIL14HWK12:I11]SNZ11533.1 Protein of unknown function [Pseudomonas sp. URIL14HWK12:I9]
MSALAAPQAHTLQVVGDNLLTLTRIFEDDVNLAAWQRCLSEPVQTFARALSAQSPGWGDSLSLDVAADTACCDLSPLLRHAEHLPGHAAFLNDLQWVADAFCCLLGVRRLGVRLRVLEKAMCPRWHVDHVPVRLITTYTGSATQWLDASGAQQHLAAGDLALLKGEKWIGNQGRGVQHRSPPLAEGERRLIMTLDWLA